MLYQNWLDYKCILTLFCLFVINFSRIMGFLRASSNKLHKSLLGKKRNDKCIPKMCSGLFYVPFSCNYSFALRRMADAAFLNSEKDLNFVQFLVCSNKGIVKYRLSTAYIIRYEL